MIVLVNALRGAVMAYRFKSRMEEQQFEYIRSLAVFKLAVALRPLVVVAAEKKAKAEQHEEAVAALEASNPVARHAMQLHLVGEMIAASLEVAPLRGCVPAL